MDESQIEVTKT